ncbi:MAG: UrcA family protein [Parvularculaceae bacterium]
MKTIHMTIAALAFGALAAAPAAAQSKGGDFEFRYKTYELANETTRSLMLDRLEREARRHCRAGRFLSVSEKLRCTEGIVDDVVDELENRRFQTAQRDDEFAAF